MGYWDKNHLSSSGFRLHFLAPSSAHPSRQQLKDLSIAFAALLVVAVLAAPMPCSITVRQAGLIARSGLARTCAVTEGCMAKRRRLILNHFAARSPFLSVFSEPNANHSPVPVCSRNPMVQMMIRLT